MKGFFSVLMTLIIRSHVVIFVKEFGLTPWPSKMVTDFDDLDRRVDVVPPLKCGDDWRY